MLQQTKFNVELCLFADHHKDATPALAAYKKTIEQVGSCATLIAERLIDAQAPAFDTQTAGLLIATILLDTINLEPEAGRMTSKDVEVVDRLKTYCADELSTDELYHAVTAGTCLSSNRQYTLLFSCLINWFIKTFIFFDLH